MNLVHKLLSSGLDIHVRDNQEKYNTLLHWAASFSNKDAVHFLVGIRS